MFGFSNPLLGGKTPSSAGSGELIDAANLMAWNESTLSHLAAVGTRMIIAGLLGALVAFRPWRRFMKKMAPPRTDSAHAQTLIAIAGAMMVVVIGDSLERAFGLVGLGAFIRFRSGIKDPRDAAVMFVMIGVGMACGLGLVPLAIGVALLCTLLLAYFDFVGQSRARRLRVVVRAADLRAIQPEVQAAFPGSRVIETWHEQTGSTPAEKRRLVIEADLPQESDAGSILAMLESRGVAGLHSVTLEED